MSLSDGRYHSDIIFAGTGGYPIWENYKELKDEQPLVSFIHLPHLAFFLENLKHKTVLITDPFCDHTVSQNGDDIVIHHRILGTTHPGFKLPLNENVVHWFGGNLNLDIPGRTSPQFIGVLNTNQYLWFVTTNPTFLPKDKLCYMNFGYTSQDRVVWYQHLSKQPFIYDGIKNTLNAPGIDYMTVKMHMFFEETARSKYAIVPPGHGIDTFRLYETLLMRTIPICINYPYYQHFKDWPVLLVNDYSELTEDLLNAKWDELDNRFNSFYDKLTKTANVENIRSKIEMIKNMT